jgi:hypothetical protein
MDKLATAREILDLDEAADFARRSTESLRRAVTDGRLRAIPGFRGRLLFSLTDLREYLARSATAEPKAEAR